MTDLRDIASLQQRVEELAGANMRQQHLISRLRLELQEKQDGLTVLSELQQSVGADPESGSDYEIDTAAMLRMDRLKSKFFASVSHELRTPMTLLLGPLDDLRSELRGPLPPAIVEQVDLAHRSAARVLHLVDQVLEVGRLNEVRARRLDLAGFTEQLALRFASSAAQKNLTLGVHTPPEPLRVYADPQHLDMALSYVLANAIESTPADGAVRVSVEADAGMARVAVRDSGPGMPACELSTVFGRPNRTSESSMQTQPEPGIGLALAKELMEVHRGALSVESEDGFGSTFSITLRRGRAHFTRAQIVAEGEPEPRPHGNDPLLPKSVLPPEGDGAPLAEDENESAEGDHTTVLVVDDNADVRAYVRRHLAPRYRVIEAADGDEGLEKARTRLPDLVLSDVIMPRRDGYALCQALKTDPETDFIPIVLLTAKASPEDRLEGFHQHADDYLTKPFDVAELKARVENLITSRKRLQERFREEVVALVRDVDAPPMTLHPSEVDVASADVILIERVREVIEARMGDESLTVEELAEEVGNSRSHLYRRLRELLDQSPSEVIRTMRLERAAQLLELRAGTVSEVAYAVGYKSVAHFSNSFDRHFDCRPSTFTASE